MNDAASLLVLPYAMAYHKRRWRIVKIGFKEKSPLESDWPHRTRTDLDVQRDFSGTGNIGVVMGSASDWLADVDLDCAEAIDLAPEFLPPTLMFGRKTARCSHYLYRSVGARTRRFALNEETLIELRAETEKGPGSQTVFPGSIHKGTGELIEFEEGGMAGSSVTEISAVELTLLVAQIDSAIRHIRQGKTRAEAITLARTSGPSAQIIPMPKRAPVRNPELRAAAEAYNRKFPRTYPPSGSGTCPVCQHNNCFGALKDDNTGKWSCFSAGHDGVGVKKDNLWYGDALDLAAHEGRCSVGDVLRREGLLGPKQVDYPFERQKGGEPIASMSNGLLALEREKPDLYYDLFVQRIILNGRGWTDADDLDMLTHFQRDLGLRKFTLEITRQAVRCYAYRNARNPVTDFLNGLTWDGTRRIEESFLRIFGAKDTPYSQAVGRNFWRALVARPLFPGCQSDHMVVLEGDQGILKSSACRIIGGEWFAETDQMPTHKDFLMLIHGKWLVEIGEMHAFSRAEVASVKQTITRRDDTFRAPYASHIMTHQRHGLFIGTTNQTEWAKDPTGGRRFWPIRCGTVDLEYLKANREQLLAEGVHDVCAGEKWYRTPDAETREEQEARYLVDPWEPPIASWLAQQPPDYKFHSNDILIGTLHKQVADITLSDQIRVCNIIKRLGCVRAPGREGRARLWLRQPPTTRDTDPPIITNM